MVSSDEQRCLAIGDFIAFEVCGLGDHEQLLAVNVDLRNLLRMDRVLDRKLMKRVSLLEDAHLLGRRGLQTNPRELIVPEGNRRGGER